MNSLIIASVIYLLVVIISYHYQDSFYKKQGVNVEFKALLGLSLTFPLQVVLSMYQFILRLFGVHLVVNAMIQMEPLEEQNKGDE